MGSLSCSSVWEDCIRTKFDNLSKGFQDDYEQVEKFLEYFERTWLGSINSRTWERRAPLFAHSLWSKYQAVLDNDVLTSNAAEGYNHALSASLPKNASICALIEQLRMEKSSIGRKLRDSAMGLQNNQATNPNTSRNLKKNQRAADLQNLVRNYPMFVLVLCLSLSYVFPVLRLSCLCLSLFYVCPVLRLSVPPLSCSTFVLSHVCLFHVCPSTTLSPQISLPLGHRVLFV